MTFTFTNKETYLQYRADWKQRYAKLSALIRDFKFARQGTLKITRLGQSMERYAAIEKAHRTQWGFYPAVLAWAHRRKATAMLDELKLAKIEAQRQYLADRAAQIAVTQ